MSVSPANYLIAPKLFPVCAVAPPNTGGPYYGPLTDNAFGLTRAQWVELYWRVARLEIQVTGTGSSSATPPSTSASYPAVGADDFAYRRYNGGDARHGNDPRQFVTPGYGVWESVSADAQVIDDDNGSGSTGDGSATGAGSQYGQSRSYVVLRSGNHTLWNITNIYFAEDKFWPFLNMNVGLSASATSSQITTKRDPHNPDNPLYDITVSQGGSIAGTDIAIFSGPDPKGEDGGDYYEGYTKATIDAVLELSGGQEITGTLKFYTQVTDYSSGSGTTATGTAAITAVRIKATKWFTYGGRWDEDTGAPT